MPKELKELADQEDPLLPLILGAASLAPTAVSLGKKLFRKGDVPKDFDDEEFQSEY